MTSLKVLASKPGLLHKAGNRLTASSSPERAAFRIFAGMVAMAMVMVMVKERKMSMSIGCFTAIPTFSHDPSLPSSNRYCRAMASHHPGLAQDGVTDHLRRLVEVCRGLRSVEVFSRALDTILHHLRPELCPLVTDLGLRETQEVVCASDSVFSGSAAWITVCQAHFACQHGHRNGTATCRFPVEIACVSMFTLSCAPVHFTGTYIACLQYGP